MGLMAPKLTKKRKAAAASRSAAPARKKQKTSSSLHTDSETAPSSSDSPPPVPRAGPSYGAGPSAGVESEGLGVASCDESKLLARKLAFLVFFCQNFIQDSIRSTGHN